MKRFLAILLAACMVFSGMVFAVSADDAAATGAKELAVAFAKEKTVTPSNNIISGNSSIVGYKIGVGPYDFSAYDSFEFDINVEKLAKTVTSWELELSDKGLDQYDAVVLNGIEVKQGDNHVKINLGDYQFACDLTKVTDIRFRTHGEVDVGQNDAIKYTISDAKLVAGGSAAEAKELEVPFEKEKTVTPTAGTIGYGDCNVYNNSTTLDLTGWTYFEFDVNVPKLSTYITKWEFMMCEGNAENAKQLLGILDLDLKAGYNHVKIKLADLEAKGGVDVTKIGFIRFRNADTADHRTVVGSYEPVTYVFSNGMLTVDDPNTIKLFGWGKSADFKGDCGAASLIVGSAFTAVDASAMDSLEFDVTVTNAAALANTKWELEMTSGGTCDKEENNSQIVLGDYVKGGLKDGENHVVVPFAALGGRTGGECNKAEMDFVRIYNMNGFAAGEGMTIKFSNLKVTKAFVDPNMANETYTFDVFQENEKAFLDHSNAGNNGAQRFSDGKLETVYHYAGLKNVSKATAITWQAVVGSQLLLQFSADGKDWKTVINAPTDKALKKIDVKAIEGLTITTDLWVRIADCKDDDGNGGSIFKDAPCVLNITYKIDPTLPDAQPPVTEMAVKFEKERKITPVGGGIIGDATDPSSRIVGYKQSVGPFDFGAYDYFEFDINVEKLAKPVTDWVLELSDSGLGKCGEVTLNGIEVKQGDNHVKIALKDYQFACDLTKVTDIRFRTTASVDVGQTDAIKYTISDAKLTTGSTEPDVPDEPDEPDEPVEPENPHEIYNFMPHADGDKAFFDEEASTYQDNGSFYFVDGTNCLILKYTIENYKAAVAMTWSAKIAGRDRQIDVSLDGKTWVNALKDTADKGIQDVIINLGDYVNIKAASTLYIKLADADTSGGAGLQFLGQPHTKDGCTLDVEYDPTLDTSKVRIDLPAPDEIEGVAAKKVVGKEIGGPAGAMFQWTDAQNPVDISKMDFFEFDFYTNNPDVVGKTEFRIDITSAGRSDVQEMRCVTSLNGMAGKNIVAGWNHVVISLGEFANQHPLYDTGAGTWRQDGLADKFENDDVNLKAINFIRMFNNGAMKANEDIIVAVANMKFTQDPNVIKLDWEAGATLNGDVAHAGFNKSVKLETPVDVSKMTNFEFDFEISDADKIKDIPWNLELTSSGTFDKEENQKIFKLANAKNGVNHVKIGLDDFDNTDGLNRSAFNFIRIFSNAAIPGTENLVLKITNVKFTYEAPAEPSDDGFAHEKHIFRVFEDSEADYLARTNAGNNGTQRFSDGTFETVYKYTIKNIYSVEKIEWTAKVGAQLLLQVSMDDVNYVDAFKWEGDIGEKGDQGMATAKETFDLTEFVDFTKSNTLYIRIADSYPQNGWGGSIYKGADTILDVTYTKLTDEELDAKEAAPTADSISLFGCNKAFGGFKLDKEEQMAGSACLWTAVGGGFVNQIKFDTPVDGTGFDTLEFDLFVTDVALFDKFAGAGMNSGLELTSAGKCDNSEISWNLAKIKANNMGGELVNGWNHIVLYLSTADKADGDTGAFNQAAINFIRFFMVNEPEDTGITLKIDNFRLTKAYANAVEAAKAEAAPVIEKLTALDQLIKAGITEDNLSTVKKNYNAAEKALKNLSALAKEQVSTDLKKVVNDAKKAIEDFEAQQTTDPTTNPTTNPTTDPTTTDPTTDPTEPTDDKGCKSIVAAGVGFMVVAALGAAAFVFKKKED